MNRMISLMQTAISTFLVGASALDCLPYILHSLHECLAQANSFLHPGLKAKIFERTEGVEGGYVRCCAMIIKPLHFLIQFKVSLQIIYIQYRLFNKQSWLGSHWEAAAWDTASSSTAAAAAATEDATAEELSLIIKAAIRSGMSIRLPVTLPPPT